MKETVDSISKILSEIEGSNFTEVRNFFYEDHNNVLNDLNSSPVIFSSNTFSSFLDIKPEIKYLKVKPRLKYPQDYIKYLFYLLIRRIIKPVLKPILEKQNTFNNEIFEYNLRLSRLLSDKIKKI